MYKGTQAANSSFDCESLIPVFTEACGVGWVTSEMLLLETCFERIQSVPYRCSVVSPNKLLASIPERCMKPGNVKHPQRGRRAVQSSRTQD